MALCSLAVGQKTAHPETGAVLVSGKVVDASGAPVPDATISFKIMSRGGSQSVRTGSDGAFSFSAQPRKHYELTISCQGFMTIVKHVDAGSAEEFHAGNIALAVGTGGGVLVQGPPALVIHGLDGSSATLTVDDLAKLPPQLVKAIDHGNVAAFRGVLLSDVLSKVTLPTSKAVSYYLLVEAQDAYRAVFAWGELDPTIAERSVYLVTERDGMPLSDKEGPFRIIAPGEKRAARWVRQVTALSIKRAD
jgi:hypothetical protein